MCHLHFVALGAGIGQSAMYFLHSAAFGYGSKLIDDGEMTYEQVYR